MQSLAHYAQQVEEICSLIDEETGDLDALQTRFEQASADMSSKVDNWVGYLRALKSRVGYLKSVRDEYIKGARAAEATDKRLREYLKFEMESHPDIPFKGSDGSLRLQNNGQAALAIAFDLPDKTVYEVIDQSLLSLEPGLNKYTRAFTFYVLDRELLKKDLEAVAVAVKAAADASEALQEQPGDLARQRHATELVMKANQLTAAAPKWATLERGKHVRIGV